MSICSKIRKNIAARLLGKDYVILTVENYNELKKIEQQYRTRLDEYKRRLQEAEIGSREYRFYKSFVDTLVDLEKELHNTDDVELIIDRTLQRACEFYGADWSGFLDVDTVMKVWSPYKWYNPGKNDMTRKLMAEFESIDCMKRWMKAMEEGEPVFIPDTAAIRNSDPTEYEMYRKLNAKCILAVPVFPRPTGFMVVRNPTKYMSPEESAMLQMFAYVMLTSINDKKSAEMLSMTYTSEEIENPNEVMIHLFGEVKIVTSTAVFTEKMLSAPAAVQLLTFLILNQNKLYTSKDIAERFSQDNLETDTEKMAGNLRTQISRVRKYYPAISDLIISPKNGGYMLNGAYCIKTDIQMFKKCTAAAFATNSNLDKIDNLKKAVNMYHGDILKSASGSHWLMQDANYWHLQYINAVNLLLEALAKYEEYSSIQQYGEQSLNIASGNINAYYWLVIAYIHLNAPEIARGTLGRAKKFLIEEDYADLIEKLKHDSIVIPNSAL